MRIFTIFLVLFITAKGIQAQSSGSFIHNSGFEITNWQDIAWFSQTNTGAEIISNQSDFYFNKHGITAHTGLRFAYIGGTQNPAGLYEGRLVQEFNLPHPGNAKLAFYMDHVNQSADPGSVIKIFIDGNEVWSILPHYIVDPAEEYELIIVELGHLAEGNHTIEIYGYENPLGGDMPMQFSFDDFTLQSLSTASINNEENIGLNITFLPGQVQIQTAVELNEDITVELVDLSGKIVTTSKTYFQNSYNLPVNELNTGIYVLNLKTDTYTFSRKLFIQH